MLLGYFYETLDIIRMSGQYDLDAQGPLGNQTFPAHTVFDTTINDPFIDFCGTLLGVVLFSLFPAPHMFGNGFIHIMRTSFLLKVLYVLALIFVGLGSLYVIGQQGKALGIISIIAWVLLGVWSTMMMATNARWRSYLEIPHPDPSKGTIYHWMPYALVWAHIIIAMVVTFSAGGAKGWMFLDPPPDGVDWEVESATRKPWAIYNIIVGASIAFVAWVISMYKGGAALP